MSISLFGTYYQNLKVTVKNKVKQVQDGRGEVRGTYSVSTDVLVAHGGRVSHLLLEFRLFLVIREDVVVHEIVFGRVRVILLRIGNLQFSFLLGFGVGKLSPKIIGLSSMLLPLVLDSAGDVAVVDFAARGELSQQPTLELLFVIATLR